MTVLTPKRHSPATGIGAHRADLHVLLKNDPHMQTIAMLAATSQQQQGAAVV